MWAAGLFEGEGSVVARGGLSLGMTDEDVVRRFQSVIGLGTVGLSAKQRQHYTGKYGKPFWHWRVNHRDDIIAVAELLYPHLGVRRRQQLDVMLPAVRAKKQLKRSKVVVCQCGFETSGQGLALHQKVCRG